MTGLKRTLPDIAVYPADVKAARQQLCKRIDEANKSVEAYLAMIPDMKINVPQKLGDFTLKAINEATDAQLERLDKLSDDLSVVMGKGELNYRRKQIENRRDIALKHVGVIRKLKADYPEGSFIYDPREHKIFCENLDEIAEKSCGVEVTPQVKELYRLLCNTHDDFQRLQRYAKENGFNDWQPKEILNFNSPTEFINSWLLGGLDRQPTQAQLDRRYRVMGGNL